MTNMVFQLMTTQFRIFFREPGVLFWVFGFPILMATILGVAFQQGEDEQVRIGILSGNASAVGSFQSWMEGLPETRREKSEYGSEWHVNVGEQKAERARFSFLSTEREQALRLIKRGVITLFLEADSHSITFHFDPRNSGARLNYLLIKNALREGALQTLEIKTSPLSSAGSRYIDFLIPGLMALGVMNSCIWGIGWSLIEMRMKKLLRRLIATPMRKSALLFSSFMNRFLLSSFELLVLFTFAMITFDLEIQGRVFDIVLLIFCGNIAFAGIAILMSSRTESTIVGNGLINAITLPMMALSGIFFSYHNFPGWSIPIVQALPLTLLADAMRSIIIEGASIVEMTVPILSLIATGLIASMIGLKFYKWH